MIDGYTRVCGVIGNPVEHTMSPTIHNTLAQKLSHNLVYIPFRVEKGEAVTAVKGAYALNMLGMNVTVPFKSEVIPALVNQDLRGTTRICRGFIGQCAVRKWP